MQPKRDPLIILFVVTLSIMLVALLPFLLITLTSNNKKEVEVARQKPVVSLNSPDPVSRIQESDQALAQANVRQAGSIVEFCITKELGLDKKPEVVYSNGASGCANVSYLTGTGHYAKVIPGGVALIPSLTKDAVCVRSLGGTVTYWYSSSVGKVQTTSPAGCSEQTS